MSSISLQATQKEADDACMVGEEPLAGFSEALKELKDYRDGKIELKPLDDLLNEL